MHGKIIGTYRRVGDIDELPLTKKQASVRFRSWKIKERLSKKIFVLINKKIEYLVTIK